MSTSIVSISLSLSLALAQTLPTLDQARRSDDAPVKIQATGRRESLEPKINGQPHGKAKYYHPNGQLYGVIEYKHGKKTGTHMLFREDGTREQELSFIDGRLDGVSRWFDANGEVKMEATYANGRLVSERNPRLAQAHAKQPIKQPVKDPLNTEIDKAVNADTSLEQLIEIALKEPKAQDALSQNIKARAYKFLKLRAEREADRLLLKKHEARFLEDWKRTKHDWINARSAELLLILEPPEADRADLILAAMGDHWIMMNQPQRATEESRMLRLVRGLRNAPTPSSTLPRLLEVMKNKLPLSARLTDEALTVIDGWAPKLSQDDFDQIVLSRFAFRTHVEAQKNLDPKQGHLTIWTFASREEVEKTLAHFDRTACLRPLRPDAKVWHYDHVLAGQSETQFRDLHGRLTCGK